MSYEGRKIRNEISGNGITIDYEMLRNVLRVAFNKAKWDLVHQIQEMDWDMKVIGTHSDRVKHSSQSFDDLCKSLAVVSAIDVESPARANNIKWANLPHQESCQACDSLNIYEGSNISKGIMHCIDCKEEWLKVSA
tara:strand:+ start:71 stop:478 length:408 start_codon:yes stop_codon:yes gene_type:complete